MGRRALSSVDGHAWYKELRTDHPSDEECWVWPRSDYKVAPGAFWRDVRPDDRRALVPAREYLYRCLVDAAGTSTDEYHPGAACKDRCVNPEHMRSTRSTGAVRSSSPVPRTARMVSYGYLNDLVYAVWRAVSPDDKDGFAEMRKWFVSSSKRPIIEKDWKVVRSVIEERFALDEGNNDMWAVSLASGLIVDLSTLPSDAHPATVPEDYASRTGQELATR